MVLEKVHPANGVEQRLEMGNPPERLIENTKVEGVGLESVHAYDR